MVLSLDNVSFAFQNGSVEVPVVRRLSLSVRRREFVSLIGLSGSGKSTVFKLIAGLLKPDAGEIRIGGERASPGKVGYMPQKDLLLPWRTVLQNVALPNEIAGEDKAQAEARAREWLSRTGLHGFEQAYPHQLSGGMRQRAAFLRTMMTGKDVLLLDEPFGALDALTKREMHRWMLSLWDRLDKTIVFITHDLEEAVLLSDRIYILKADGQGSIGEFPVRLPRPRDPGMVHAPEMLDYRIQLERLIHEN